MDFQEFLADPPFWSFGEKAVGRRHGLVSKSNIWIKLLVRVNSEYFFCVSGMLLSCQCLHLSQFVSERQSSPWSVFGKWILEAACCCSRQYVTLLIYWLASPRNLHLAISSSSRSWKNRQYRKLQAMMDSLLTTSDLCMELWSGKYCVSSLVSSQVVKVLHILLYVKDQRRSRFPSIRSRYLARLLAIDPLISTSPSSTFCFLFSHFSRLLPDDF